MKVMNLWLIKNMLIELEPQQPLVYDSQNHGKKLVRQLWEIPGLVL